MSKIPRELENPIDKFLLNISQTLVPEFRKYNFTPNGLTTISLITGILAVDNIYNSNFILGIIFIWTSYLFDCIDGMFARKYDMVTTFGDYYDHVKDAVVGILIILVIMSKFGTIGKINIILVGVMVWYLTMIYICNYERYYLISTNNHETISLNFLSKKCKQNNTLAGVKKEIQKYKYVGYNLLYVLMSLLLVFLYFKK